MTTKKNETRTLVSTSVRPQVSRASTRLTWEEEMTVRMRHGLSEGPDTDLEFRGQLHGEVRARLGAMEAEMLAAMFQRGPLAEEFPAEDSGVSVDEATRARIIETLARLRGASEN